MLAAAAIAALALAAPPAPIPLPAEADAVVFARRLGDAAKDARALLATAGHYAPTLRPEGFSRDLFPGLPDVLDAGALAAAGFDLDAPFSLFDVGSGLFASLGVKDPATARKNLERYLSTAAQARRTISGFQAGVQGQELTAAFRIDAGRALIYLGGADDPRRVLAGLKAPLSGDAAARFAAAAAALAPRRMLLWVREGGGAFGEIGLGASGAEAVFHLPAVAQAVTPLEATHGEGDVLWGESGLGDFTEGGRREIDFALRLAIGAACKACNAEALAKRVSASLAGPVAIRIAGLDLRGLRSPTASSFAYLLRGYLLFPLAKDANALALARDVELAMKKAGAGHHLKVGITPATDKGPAALYFANGVEPPRALWAPPAAPALDGALDTHRLAAAFEPFGVGDLASGGSTAVLATIHLEFGPLLEHSGPVTLRGTRTPAGYDLTAKWPLDPPAAQ